MLALLSILYGSVMAFTQTNARLILGYSSVAQLGFITLGMFAADNAAAGAQGALMQAIQHGLVVAPMILVIVLLAERSAGSEDIRDMGGIAFRAPVLAGLFLVATLATLAMPGSANFVGEFLILLGMFNDRMVFAFIASIGVVLAAVYALRLYIRAMHNRTGPAVTSFEMSLRDGLVLVPLVLAIVAFALKPQARSTTPSGRSSARWRRCCRPAARSGRRPRCARDRLAAQAKAPEIDWAALSPVVALTVGACLVLLLGLARARFVRTRAVPALALITLGVDRRAVDLAVERERLDHRERARDGRLHARADAAVLRGGRRAPCCCRGAARPPRRPARASTTRCC